MRMPTATHRFLITTLFLVLGVLLVGGCGDTKKPAEGTEKTAVEVAADEAAAEKAAKEAAEKAAAKAANDSLPTGLLLAYSAFEVENGKATARTKPARLEILKRQGGKWRSEVIEDPESNVFHKAIYFAPKYGKPGILTLGGMGAAIKIWRKGAEGYKAETLWSKKFGGKFDRMRDAEISDLFDEGPAIAVATHDQGVVAILTQNEDASWTVKEIDEKKDTFVHEIEIGDLDGDGKKEIYATPSEPNRMQAKAQHGEVMRYDPQSGKGKVVADLGDRHAKEIYVGDVDGDGKEELYVSVEGQMKKDGASMAVAQSVELRRYESGTKKDEGKVIATIDGDHLMRFLTVGDVDGDGKKEMVAASFSKGLWLLRPGKNPNEEWSKESIDRNSGGFEHASLLTDLDGDGKDELYVAADNQGEFRRYTWKNGRARSETLRSRKVPSSMMTWNIMPIPVSALE